MEQQNGYQEKKRHGGAGFDFNIYPCTIPVDFPQVALHWQSSMELLFVKKGIGLVQAGLERLDAAAGDIFVFAPGVLHGIYGVGERMEYENIIFSLELLSGTEDLCTERYLLPLQAGRIYGAALDVTSPEPLPAEHPLWDCENLLLTPHISGQTFQGLKGKEEFFFALCRENLELYREGRPLKNRVDLTTGYRLTGG